jgi:RNA polymerase sigma-70 factor (ECF subfamily)
MRKNAMIQTEIETLVLRAQQGDRQAYGELFVRFHPTVYAIALARLRNPTEAEELAQEVFVHGMRKLPQLRDPRCFPGWLRMMTTRMAINRKTRKGRVQGVESEVLENTEDRGAGPLALMIRAEDAEQVNDGLAELKDMDRDTLVAFYGRGASLEQMSNEFDAPVGTIKRRLHVARNRLKEVLQREPAPTRNRKRKTRGKGGRRPRELACV